MHTEFDHLALNVTDLSRSCDFYERVLRLRPIPRPGFKFDGAWYRLAPQFELHLICRAPHPTQPPGRDNHFALRVAELDSWEEHFQQLNIAYRARKFRPDGAEQLFLQDPDGHFIELCTAPSPKASHG